MIRTVSEEQVNGISINWTHELTESVHDAVRLWVERYRDLLPPQCTTLVVSWDAFGFATKTGYAVVEVEDRPDTFTLFIGDAWHSLPDTREQLFVLERLIRAWLAEGLLVDEGDECVLRMSEDVVMYGAERDRFLETVAEGLVLDRGRFGGSQPPCPLR